MINNIINILKKFAPMLICIMLMVFIGTSCSLKNGVPEYAEIDGYGLVAQTGERYLKVYDKGEWKPIVIKGINIGTALPGKWFTNFPADRDIYRNWLENAADLNVNTIRIYTLLDPTFYQVFLEYNQNPDNPRLWLLQEIWPEEVVPEHNLNHEEYKAEYKREIEMAINAIHGSASIPSRPYRAYGNYTADVSPYTLGLIIGREIEPEEVEATDDRNSDYTTYPGEYVMVAKGSPTECWLAEMCDFAASYSADNFAWQHPVSFVSWPTLDPLEHPTERDKDGKRSYNDREEVNPAHFEIGPKNIAGLFGSYHIYPNYPDLMNNEPDFARFSDDMGEFRYLGYLNSFMEIHPPYPALVAEFGMSSSLNTAHFNPDGLHHGGIDEIYQGEMIVRMMESIVKEKYAGGIIFQLSDEWAKKTWNTEPFMIPYERQVFWKNTMCPEQNYGIIALEPDSHIDNKTLIWERGSVENADSINNHFPRLKALNAMGDASYLYLIIELDTDKELDNIVPWDDLGLAIGIDTYDPKTGETVMPVNNLPELPTGIEFLLVLSSPEEACFLSIPSYNRGNNRFSTKSSNQGIFERINPIVNRARETYDGRIFPELRSDESNLVYGIFDPESDDYNSLAHWYIDESKNQIVIRLPWILLNVADPSSLQVLDDSGTYTEPPQRDIIKTTTTEGMFFYGALFEKDKNEGNNINIDPRRDRCLDNSNNLGEAHDFQPARDGAFIAPATPYRWEEWEEVSYVTRRKKSFDIVADYFAAFFSMPYK